MTWRKRAKVNLQYFSQVYSALHKDRKRVMQVYVLTQ